ncbi:LodA/GoxA family CTQ-dependent oxidase [Aliiglaciecola sp. LCG003]|uniref:LodA/GoxA family CTQ-dependent oxidase n=1 Tax=Aliiglaciecola sp. LCG003 TaxID=3053655 RepID=UPI002573697C|nr:LodA/GoxA family CTQ-dependent oxidase [Aliiglaciecola sp. LCG003]WJG09881.1 LodA/GoxA family CTQ-dependent oxidase [Aliiglaciecola sp. LCG003]
MKHNSNKHSSVDKEPSANTVKCWEGQADPTERLKQMFVDLGQKRDIASGSKPARRAVFRKQHGIVYGHFNIRDDIKAECKLGIFAGDKYECAVRFSSDTGPTSPDLSSTMGVGLKLFGVKGKKLFGEGNNADFIFQNIDRFFAKDAKQFCEFTTAGVVDHNYAQYLEEHPEVAQILTDMEKIEASCLTASYWAILPFKLGDKHIVKYRLVPEDSLGGAAFDDDNYLALDLASRLRNGEAKFRFEIQLRTGDDMPIDNAQKVWSTQASPFMCIADLIFPQQDICAIGQSEFGQNLSFNIYRTLAEHEPLGSIAQARKVVYQASADARHQANGQSMQEPEQINPAFKDDEEDDSDCIVYAGIYPPIGVMRVGNSKHEYFIGPEVNQPKAQHGMQAYRDKTGAIKRQAARFRVYGFNAAGKAVKELTADNAKIKWHSHLANQKSSWYEFQLALDIPEAADAPSSMLRNSNVADRSRLLIDGGKKSISGKQQGSEKFNGKFLGESVYLGEMFTDELGRLIMLGGHGKAENINGDLAITFANNEGWYDDTSDGPVTAEVEYEGISIRVLPAWVICAPPDFAPMQKSVRTMWDLMRDVAINSGMLNRPPRPSFSQDILPIFQRMTDLQWVNAGFAAAFGWGGPFDYTTAEWIAKLADPSSANFEMRHVISNSFRRYHFSGAQSPQLWPWVYGDAMSVPASGSVRQNATLSDLQLAFLEQWADGDFIADYAQQQTPASHVEELPIEQQPDMLTQAAMEFCLADAFHPGCEMTWPMRNPGMYMTPYRLQHAKKTQPTNGHYYGPVMSSDVISLPEGPLMGGQVAGGITRWMAIPWHCDTASCRDGYESKYDPYVPTFWPARVPNNILSEAMYNKVLDNNLSAQERKQSFAYREAWLNDLPIEEPVTYTKQINGMIKHFDSLAIVQQSKETNSDIDFPPKMQIGITAPSVKHGAYQGLKSTDNGRPMHSEGQRSKVDLRHTEKVNRFNKK